MGEVIYSSFCLYRLKESNLGNKLFLVLEKSVIRILMKSKEIKFFNK